VRNSLNSFDHMSAADGDVVRVDSVFTGGYEYGAFNIGRTLVIPPLCTKYTLSRYNHPEMVIHIIDYF